MAAVVDVVVAGNAADPWEVVVVEPPCLLDLDASLSSSEEREKP